MRLRVNEDLSQELKWRSSKDNWKSQHPWFLNEKDGDTAGVDQSAYFRSNRGSITKRRGSIGRDALRGFPKEDKPWVELKVHADRWLLEALRNDLDTLRMETFANLGRSNKKRLSGRERMDERERIEKALSKSKYLTNGTKELLKVYRWDLELLKISEKTRSLFPIVEELAAALSKLKRRDVLHNSKRVSSEEARRVIEKLDDVQMVIQIILAKWEDTEE
jgi:hypothetical protein